MLKTKLSTRYSIRSVPKKELKAKGILEGGILKVRTLQGVVNDADFTKADLRNVSSIPLNVKKATLMTSHPEGSYTFVKEGKVITELSITNPKNSGAYQNIS